MSRPSGAGTASGIIPVRLRQIALVADDLVQAEKELVAHLSNDTDVY